MELFTEGPNDYLHRITNGDFKNRPVYKELWNMRNMDDSKTVCDVCLTSWDQERDKLVYCEECNEAVH